MPLTTSRFIFGLLWSVFVTMGATMVSFHFSHGSGLRATLFGFLAALINIPVLLWFGWRQRFPERNQHVLEVPAWGCPSCHGTAMHVPECPRRSEPLPPDPFPLPSIEDP